MAMPSLILDLSSSNLKFQWKLSLAEHILCSVDASLYRDNLYTPVTCILTKDSIIILNEDEDAIQHVHQLANLSLEPSLQDPTLSVLKVLRQQSPEDNLQLNDRVAQFVLESIQFAGNRSELTEDDIPGLRTQQHIEEEYLLYVNPSLLHWFTQCLESAQQNFL